HHLSLPLSSFFSHDPSTTALYTLSLHDALPIYLVQLCHSPNVEHSVEKSGILIRQALLRGGDVEVDAEAGAVPDVDEAVFDDWVDRKSTRLNSSHVSISYAVFCLKKKNNNNIT